MELHTEDGILKKLEQIEPFEKGMDNLFKAKYNELLNLELLERDKLPTYGGIYVFYKDDDPIYVGRTDNVRVRIQKHTRKGSKRGNATFAFNLAKRDYEDKYGKEKITRKDLENNEQFIPLFVEKKEYLSDCKYRCIEIANDILQTMFEPYIAYKIGTYPEYNTFENH
jgi:GIY-YIG catalytic domain-containing protein